MKEITEVDLNRIRSQIPGIIKQVFTQEAPTLIEASIGTNFEDGAKGDGPSTSTKLYIGTGQLARSLKKGDKNNIFNFSMTENEIKLEYGTKLQYAKIHETGGFIKSKGRMASFFWAKFYETKSPYYRNLALKVMKVGGVNIPPRPYLEPGFKLFNEKYLPMLLDSMIKKIIEII